MTEIATKVLLEWRVPGLPGSQMTPIQAVAGQHTTIVGANGSGKSSLGFWLSNHSDSVKVSRVIAHRKLWFQAAGPAITAADRVTYQTNIDYWSSTPDSRYVDNADAQRTNIVLFDVLGAVNAYNARATELFVNGASTEVVSQELGKPPLARLNDILIASGLAVVLEVNPEAQTFDVVNISGARYPIFQMSDGEKSAVLLACEVLVARKSSIQIIDEPERHLHRSVSSGLIRAILNERTDCHFVVVTHDLELADALSVHPGNTFSLAKTEWTAGDATGWDLRRIEADEALPDAARRAILGGRKDILFTEGVASSLDAELYRALLPNWEIQPSGGADQVVRNVRGLGDNPSLHWVNARGLVDGDARSDEERASLAKRGIVALGVSEVENVYFLPALIDAVARSHAATLGKDPEETSSSALGAALQALTAEGTLERLAKKLAVAAIRRRAVDSIPDDLDTGESFVEIRFESPYPEILAELEAAADREDLDRLVCLLPVRDTSLRSQVARSLGFLSPADYQGAARVALRDNAALAGEIRRVIGVDAIGP
ncbi:hypothetical protein DEJ30_16000 [Curtobacterium sp. MCPF17_003]|nr:hypothetical protein DEJ30_16000 [Curtobacterium sp. MCPF17_003]